jgi:hypothetical protein
MKLGTWLAMLLLSTASDRHELAFEPREDEKLLERFEVSTELKLERVEAWFATPQGRASFPAPCSDRRSEVLRVEFVDELRRVDASRIGERRRNFCAAELTQKRRFNSGAGEFSDAPAGEGLLVGRTVTFRWDRVLGEELAEVESGEPIERTVLDELRAGADGQGFLPPRPVEVGDRWRVDANVLIEYYEPGGGLRFAESDQRVMTRAFDLELLRGIDDELWCELVELQRVEERELAVIRVTGEIELQRKWDKHVSLTELLGVILEGDGTLDSTLELSVKGEVVWDLSARRLARGELRSDVSLVGEQHLTTGHGVYVCLIETWSGALIARFSVESASMH